MNANGYKGHTQPLEVLQHILRGNAIYSLRKTSFSWPIWLLKLPKVTSDKAFSLQETSCNKVVVKSIAGCVRTACSQKINKGNFNAP